MEFDEVRLWESAAMHLLSYGTGVGEDKDFDIVRLGDDVQLKVTGVSSGIEMKVVGRDYQELGEQLVLACLKKLSPGDLAELRLKELKKHTAELKSV